MAVYTTLAKVQGMLPAFTLDGTSVPTSTQAQVLIDEVAAEIETVLAGAGVTVPVTTPDYFVTRLSILNAYGATAAILKAAYPEATGPGENPAYAFWESRYKMGLAALRKGEDVPLDQVQAGPSTYFTRNPDEEEILGDLAGDHKFKIDQVF